jgi:uncharacterized membrane protein YcgQ (UPF0703/DUF1980 family)
MKPAFFIKAVFVVIAACAGIFLLQRIPHEGYHGPNVGDSLLGTIDRDRPAGVGNSDAESLMKNIERKPAVPASGIIKLSDETFAPGYDELYDHREKYYGREISVSGYVETDGLAKGQFLVGRNLVWCCETDAYFIGFLVLIDGNVPEQGAELRVTGEIEAAVYTDPVSGKTFDVPAIRAEKIEAAPKFSRDVYPL